MANWKDVLGAGKSVSKLDNLDVSENTKITLEAVMCAMAASGKVQEMALIAQTLEKIDTQVDLKSVAENVNNLGNVISNQHKTTTKAVKDTVTLTKAQFEELKTQLSK